MSPPTAVRNIALKRIIRARWRTGEASRVVMIVAVRTEDRLDGEVWGIESGAVVRIETAEGVTLDTARRIITTAAGVEWNGPSVGGCSCNTPRSLRGFRPERANP